MSGVKGVEPTPDGGMVLTGPGISLYRLLVLKRGIMAEQKGMKLFRGRSATAIVKQEMGFKGNREKVLAQLEAHIEKFAQDNQV